MFSTGRDSPRPASTCRASPASTQLDSVSKARGTRPLAKLDAALLGLPGRMMITVGSRHRTPVDEALAAIVV